MWAFIHYDVIDRCNKASFVDLYNHLAIAEESRDAAYYIEIAEKSLRYVRVFAVAIQSICRLLRSYTLLSWLKCWAMFLRHFVT